MSTTYSPISSIELTNFMAFPELKVSFDLDNPGDNGFHSEGILNIKGFNDSGKSALLIGAGVCLLNAYSRKQKSFIRDGADYFCVDVTFSDGVTVRRVKYADGSSLYEMYKGSSLEYSTKDGDFLTAVEDVPQVIKDYLGLFSDKSFNLNMRRRTDPMLLVNTKGSDNFDILNSVLKTSELNTAASMASSEANQNKAKLDELEVELRVVRENLTDIWATEEILNLLKVHVAREEALTIVLNHLEGIVTSLDEYESIQILPRNISFAIEEFKSFESSYGSIEYLESIMDSIDELNRIVVMPVDNLTPIDTDPLDTLSVLGQLGTSLDEFDPRPIPAIPDSLMVSDNLVESYEGIHGLLKEIGVLDGLKAQFEDNKSVLSDLTHEIEESGIELVECPSCHDVFDPDLLGHIGCPSGKNQEPAPEDSDNPPELTQPPESPEPQSSAQSQFSLSNLSL